MSIRRFFLSVAVASMALSASALPARPGLRTYTQPDGSRIGLHLVGDEFFHTLVDSEGRHYSLGADGRVRPADETAVNAAKRRGIERRAMRNVAVRRSAQEGMSQVPHIGSPRIPVLLVEYKDYKFKDADPKAVFDKFFSHGDSSAHQYFYDQSNGKFSPIFDLYGPITLSGNRVDYGGNDADGNDRGTGNMVGEACLGLDSEIDFSRYDNDGDGECDVVIVLYAGDGEASSDDENAADAVWQCQWALSSSEFGRALRLDNTRVDLFAVFNELYGMDLTKIDGIGSFCHEFSHCLGLPDFYDTQYGPHFGMGIWSLMDYGSYNNGGYTPCGYSAYEKEFMGWIEIPEGEPDTHYTLPAMNQKNEATDKAVKLTNPADPDEYYILENRRCLGWDKYMIAEGLMITHFTYDRRAWLYNEVNDYDMQRATIIPADNNLKMTKLTQFGTTYYQVDYEDMFTDLWPQPGVTALTDTSVPAAKVNTGGFMSKPVTDITVDPDGTVSFDLMKAPLPGVAVPHSLASERISETSVKLSWQSDDPAADSFTLEVYPYTESAPAAEYEIDFTSELPDWEHEEFAELDSSEGTMKLGSSKRTGAVISPAYDSGETGEVSVTFSAKSYGTDNSSMKVSLLDAGGNLLDEAVEPLASVYKDYTVKLTGKPGSKVKVRFEVTAKKKRVYIRSAKIVCGAEGADESGRLLFTGIKGNAYTVIGLEPGGVYSWRVKGCPADSETFAESDWSKPEKFDLSASLSVISIEGEAEETTVWYTLQGIRLQGEPVVPGIYVKVCGGNSSLEIR